jgi:hypothetical protein
MMVDHDEESNRTNSNYWQHYYVSFWDMLLPFYHRRTNECHTKNREKGQQQAPPPPQQQQQQHEQHMVKQCHHGALSFTLHQKKWMHYMQQHLRLPLLENCLDDDDDNSIKIIHHDDEHHHYYSYSPLDVVTSEIAEGISTNQRAASAAAAAAIPSSAVSHCLIQSITPIVHFPQQDTWDCGVACLLMITEWIHQQHRPLQQQKQQQQQQCHATDTTGTTDNNDSNNNLVVDGHPKPLPLMSIDHNQYEREKYIGIQENHEDPTLIHRRQSLLHVLATTSIWTIDLVIALDDWIEKYQTTYQNCCHHHHDHHHRLCVHMVFATTEIGVNTNYRSYLYYQDTFGHDQIRVQCRFNQLLNKETNRISLYPMALDHVSETTMKPSTIASSSSFTASQNEFQPSTPAHTLPLSPHTNNKHMVNQTTLARKTQERLTVWDVAFALQYGNCIAMALVDNSVLMRFGRENQPLLSHRPSLIINQHQCISQQLPYKGHYILLTGIVHWTQLPSEKEREIHGSFFVLNTMFDHDFSTSSEQQSLYYFTVQNPAMDILARNQFIHNHTDSTIPFISQYISFSCFHEAWKAPGTDSDIVFISSIT